MSANQATGRAAADTHLMCPSAQPEMEGSRVLGVVGGTAEHPELAYLNQYLPVSNELVAMAAPVKPTQVCALPRHARRGSAATSTVRIAILRRALCRSCRR
jgi:hypothetical protein